MKKAVYIIFAILLAVNTYIAGKEFNPRTITEVETVEIEKEIENPTEHGYIKLEDCIPLADITGYYYNEYDYPVFELGDIGNQLDSFNNASYKYIMKKLPNLTEEYKKAGIIK